LEQYIPLIIFAIIGAIASSKKKKSTPPSGEPKPFTATGRVPGDPVRKIQDMSREMYKELQKEFQQVATEPPSRQTAVPQPVERPVRELTINHDAPRASMTPSPSIARKAREKHRGRLSMHGGETPAQQMVEQSDLVPKNGHDLLKGIVFSEILGPPKSKR
jgi:hypothetical protein